MLPVSLSTGNLNYQIKPITRMYTHFTKYYISMIDAERERQHHFQYF